MHWIFTGLIIFGFSAPSAVVGVPYAIGTQGIVVGSVLSIIFTITTGFGSFFLLDLSSKYKQVREFQDIPRFLNRGYYEELFASCVQYGNSFYLCSVFQVNICKGIC